MNPELLKIFCPFDFCREAFSFPVELFNLYFEKSIELRVCLRSRIPRQRSFTIHIYYYLFVGSTNCFGFANVPRFGAILNETKFHPKQQRVLKRTCNSADCATNRPAAKSVCSSQITQFGFAITFGFQVFKIFSVSCGKIYR